MLLLLMLLTLPVRAAEPDWGLDALQEAVPPLARTYLGDGSLGDDPEGLLHTMGEKAMDSLQQLCPRELSFSMVLFSVVLLSSFGELADMGSRARKALRLASVLAVAASAVTDINSFMRAALDALQELSDYSRSLLPVLAASAAVNGAAASSAAKCAATGLVMDALISIGNNLIAPAICGFTALSVADAAIGSSALRSAARFMESICTLILTALAGCFTLWLGVISVLNGAGEAAGVRMTKSILTNALPVVGKLLSDAAASLSAAAGAVRASTGVFGLLVILSLCIGPFLRLGCRYLVFRLSAVFCRCLSGGSLASLLDDLASSFGMLLSVLGTGALCLFMGVWSMVRIGI